MFNMEEQGLVQIHCFDSNMMSQIFINIVVIPKYHDSNCALEINSVEVARYYSVSKMALRGQSVLFPV